MVSDDRWALEFYWEHKDTSAEALVHDVLTNEQMWGQDLTKVTGLEGEVVRILKLIREKGALEAYKEAIA